MLFTSKYDKFPDNFSLENRLESGESLKDIFGNVYGIDYEDSRTPRLVGIHDRVNYVVKNSLLFENWFTYAKTFADFVKFSYAFRDRERGVLFDRYGKYIIKEEFRDIYSDT